LVRWEIIARSFCASAANRCSTNRLKHLGGQVDVEVLREAHRSSPRAELKV
jgi:hypothetical protein